MLEVTLAEGLQLDAPSVAPLIDLLVARGQLEPVRVLADIRGARAADRDARAAAATAEVAAIVLRMALLVGNPVSAMLGNFFVRVTQPRYPTRVFTDADAARAWLIDGEAP